MHEMRSERKKEKEKEQEQEKRKKNSDTFSTRADNVELIEFTAKIHIALGLDREMHTENRHGAVSLDFTIAAEVRKYPRLTKCS